MKPTPHLIAAAAIVVIAAAVCVPALLTSGGSYPITGRVAKVATPTQPVLPAAAAVEPLAPAFAREGEDNPFTLRKTRDPRGPRITLPPPPPLTVPAPPLLPIPETP